jgi:hypothetical protein
MVFLRWYNANDLIISTTNIMPNNVTQFTTTMVSGTTFVPATAATVGISFNGTVSPSREMFADNFSLVVVPEVSAFGSVAGLFALMAKKMKSLAVELSSSRVSLKP